MSSISIQLSSLTTTISKDNFRSWTEYRHQEDEGDQNVDGDQDDDRDRKDYGDQEWFIE